MLNEERSQKLLTDLTREYTDVKNNISELTSCNMFDQLLVQRLKKKKLMLKDKIISLKQSMCDDIIA